MQPTEFMQLWTVLTSAYPGFKTPAATIEVYNRALADLDYTLAEAAVLDAVSKSKFFPTIAEIREAAARLVVGADASMPALEAWGEIKKAVAIFGRHGWAGAQKFLDERTAATIRAIGWLSFCDSEVDEEMSWRARFVELYDQYQRREVRQAQMLPAVREIAQKQIEQRAQVAQLESGLTARLTSPAANVAVSDEAGAA